MKRQFKITLDIIMHNDYLPDCNSEKEKVSQPADKPQLIQRINL